METVAIAPHSVEVVTEHSYGLSAMLKSGHGHVPGTLALDAGQSPAGIIQSMVFALRDFATHHPTNNFASPDEEDLFEVPAALRGRFGTAAEEMCAPPVCEVSYRTVSCPCRKDTSLAAPLDSSIGARQAVETGHDTEAKRCSQFANTCQGRKYANLQPAQQHQDDSCQVSSCLMLSVNGGDVDTSTTEHVGGRQADLSDGTHAATVSCTPPNPRRKSILRGSKSESDLPEHRVKFHEPVVTEEYPVPRRHSAPSSNSPRARSLQQEQPIDCADFHYQLRGSGVRLAKLERAGGDDNLFTLSVHVLNKQYLKSVFVRLTENSWYTHRDVSAHHRESLNGDVDLFEAVLTLRPDQQFGDSVQFAVGFLCAGQNFWDNNYGLNYSIG